MIVPPDAPPVPGVAGGSGPLPKPRAPARPSPAWPPGPLRTAMRMSVTFKSDGIEFRLTFWESAWGAPKWPSPAAAAPVLRSERRPIALSFVDICSPFRHQTYSRLEPIHSLIRLWYPKLNLEADARPPRGSILVVQLRRLDYAGVRKWRRPLPRTASIAR